MCRQFGSQHRLTQVTGAATTTYAYDGLDRVAKRNQTAFAYAGASTKPSSDGSFTYARTPDDALLALSDGQHPALAAQGPHGDVELTLNATGSTTTTAAYDPFGATIGTPPTSRLGYQGEWTDPATGSDWMAARWYDSTSGRFLTRDSIQPPLMGAVDTNRYTYGRANPLGYVDPSGHCDWWQGNLCQVPPPQSGCNMGGGDLSVCYGQPQGPSDNDRPLDPRDPAPPQCPGDPSCPGQTGGGSSQTGGGGGAGSSQRGSGCDFQCRLAQLLKNAPPAPYLPPPPGTRGIVKNPDPVPASGVTTLAPVQGTQQAADSGCRACSPLQRLGIDVLRGLMSHIQMTIGPDQSQLDGRNTGSGVRIHCMCVDDTPRQPEGFPIDQPGPRIEGIPVFGLGPTEEGMPVEPGEPTTLINVFDPTWWVQMVTNKNAPRVPDPSEIPPGSTPQDVLSKLPPNIRAGGYPTRDGTGMRYPDPHRPGDQVRIMPGNPSAPDPLHRGPYLEISKNGQETRIPLAGNPVLE